MTVIQNTQRLQTDLRVLLFQKFQQAQQFLLFQINRASTVPGDLSSSTIYFTSIFFVQKSWAIALPNDDDPVWLCNMFLSDSPRYRFSTNAQRNLFKSLIRLKHKFQKGNGWWEHCVPLMFSSAGQRLLHGPAGWENTFPFVYIFWIHFRIDMHRNTTPLNGHVRKHQASTS